MYLMAAAAVLAGKVIVPLALRSGETGPPLKDVVVETRGERRMIDLPDSSYSHSIVAGGLAVMSKSTAPTSHCSMISSAIR